jgi:diacylglycerol kinase family enzyme
MRHLFIINPVAKRIKGKTKPIRDMIAKFFSEYPDIHYDVFESRWCRDSLTFIRRNIANSTETVRIHSIGGSGTLFEIVNSTIGLSNVEIAVHPYGDANAFLRYFGSQNEKHFSSLKNQVFDKTILLDTIRCRNLYSMGFALVGTEAFTNMKGNRWIAKGMPEDIAYMSVAFIELMAGRASQKYNIEIDTEKIEGDFISVLVANTPCYGKSMNPAIDTHPDDGLLDVYIVKNMSRYKRLNLIPVYVRGDYHKLPGLILHYKTKKIKLSSDQVMCMSIDEQIIYGESIEYEVIPKAVKFVCPSEVDITKLPRIFGKPNEGYRG